MSNDFIRSPIEFACGSDQVLFLTYPSVFTPQVYIYLPPAKRLYIFSMVRDDDDVGDHPLQTACRVNSLLYLVLFLHRVGLVVTVWFSD